MADIQVQQSNFKIEYMDDEELVSRLCLSFADREINQFGEYRVEVMRRLRKAHPKTKGFDDTEARGVKG